jgi:transcriptional regulator with XRE-family HTH domain
VLTEFGRFLRKLRIDCGELTKDMAEKLDVTASYLSAVETGKRNIPVSWIDSISAIYMLDQETKKGLQEAADHSAKVIAVKLDNVELKRKEAAILFAREFNTMDDKMLSTIRKLLENSKKEKK